MVLFLPQTEFTGLGYKKMKWEGQFLTMKYSEQLMKWFVSIHLTLIFQVLAMVASNNWKLRLPSDSLKFFVQFNQQGENEVLVLSREIGSDYQGKIQLLFIKWDQVQVCLVVPLRTPIFSDKN